MRSLLVMASMRPPELFEESLLKSRLHLSSFLWPR